MELNKMSDVFGGKIPGMGLNVDKQLQDEEEDVVTKFKKGNKPENPFDKDVPMLGLGKEFSNPFNKEMPMLDMNFKSNSGNFDKMLSPNNFKSNFNFKNTFKMGKQTNVKKYFPKTSFNVDKKMKMYGFKEPKVSGSKTFNSKMNYYLPSRKLDNTVKQTTKTKPEKIAWKRVNEQLGLNPTGDVDNDKIVNMLDCAPLNPMRQGPLTKMRNWLYGRGFVEDDEVQTPVGTLQTYGEQEPVEPVQTYTAEADMPEEETTYYPYTPTDEEEEEESTLSKVSYFLGIPQKIEQIKEEREALSKARQAGRAAGLEYAEKERLKKEALKEFEKKAGKTKSKDEKFWRDRYLKDIAKTRKGKYKTKGRVPSPFDVVKGTASTLQRGFGVAVPGQSYTTEQLIGMSRSPYGALTALGPQQDVPFHLRVDQLVGTGQRYDEWRQQPTSPVPTRPVYTPTPTPAPTQPTPQPQYRSTMQESGGPSSPPPEPGMVWSEKSQRWVKYTRGPYKK